MSEILLAVDDSIERALAQARAVADLPMEDIRVVLLHVFVGENPNGASVHRVASIRRARERLEDAGVDIELAESSGDPAEAIVGTARERGVDLIVVAGRKRSPAGKAVLGSVSQSVLLTADRPVLFCTADEDEA